MPSLQQRVAEFTYQEKLKELLSREFVVSFESKALARVLAAINALNKETIGKDEKTFDEQKNTHLNGNAVCNQLRADLRKRFGVADAR